MTLSRIYLLACAVFIVLLPGFPATGSAQTPDRVRPIVSLSRASVPNSVSPRVRRATDLGPVADSLALTAVKLRFNLTPAQTVALDQLLADQQNPRSPRYRQWLTPEQYAANFGLSRSDLAVITAWLESYGLTVVQTARSRGFIAVSGTAAQIQSAFGTTLHRVLLDGERHFANVTEPTVPSAMATVVASVTGLNDFRLRPRSHVRPAYTSANGGSHSMAPADFDTVYDVNPLLNGSVNGAGVTIAVMGQTDISLADVAAFRAAAGLASNLPTVKLYFSDPGISSPDLDEAQLDVEWSGAIAPGASILYVNSVDVIDDSLTEAVDNDLAPIVSISYGDCEAGWGAANLATFNQLFRQANVQGQTIVGGSGDDGATDCDYNVATATQGLAVDFPSSSPYVTGVGGTMFAENGGTYWSATNGAFGSSALSYIPETAWNETSSYGALAAGGGGVSAYFAKPAFQIGTGVPNDFSRDVPDLSLNAGAVHDGYLFCSRGSCTNGFRTGSGQVNVVGGTSVSAQAFAGVLALLEQKIKTSVGNANPTIYGLANSSYAASVFHDITSGNNDSPCTAGSVNCAHGGSVGYSAAAGYDLATGWGSMDVFQFVSDWLLVPPAGISTSGTAISATVLFAASGSAASGATVTLTASVTSATSGVTTTATGKVQLLVDSMATGSPVLLASGTATISLATAGLAVGSHTLTAFYSGDSTYGSSKGAIPFTITAALATPDFTLTPSTSTTSVASGSTAPGVVFTVTPTNGFAGNVAFTASSTLTSVPYQYAFHVTPVVISSTAAGSTTLSLNAYVPEARASTGLISFGAALGLMFLLRVRRRLPVGLLFVVISAAALSVSACSSPSAAPASPRVSNTPAGTYTVLVTATSSTGGTTVTHSATVNFVVQ